MTTVPPFGGAVPGAPRSDADTGTKSKDEQKASAARRTPPGRAMRRGEDGITDALRRTYQQTIDESVPDELLDLIKKLG